MSATLSTRLVLGAGIVIGFTLAPATAQTATVAHDEHTVFAGDVVGSYIDTWVDDGQVQSIQESHTNGNPRKRKSAAEHHYVLDLPAGSSLTLFVKATTTDSGEGDDWAFLWTTDDQDFTQFLLFPAGATDLYQSASLPAGLTGVVHIVVMDTDRTGGNTIYDTISIDHLYVETVTGGPPAAPGDLSALGSSESTIDLTWTDQSNSEDGFRIERSVDGTTWAVAGTVGANESSYADTGLAASTTYHYLVYAYNGEGDSAASNQASATTLAPSTFTKVMVAPGGTWPAHDIDPVSGQPGIAYLSGDVLEFAMWDGSSWQVDVIESAATHRRPAVAFSPTGAAGICYLSGNYISFAEKTGSTWTIEHITRKSNWNRYALAYAPDGTPAICYDRRGLILERRVGGTWQAETVDPDATADAGKWIAFDAAGHPAIAYGDDLSGDTWCDTLKLARWNAATSSWDLEIVESQFLFWGVDSRLAFDPAGNPAIVHGGAANPSWDTRFLSWNGSSWDLDVVAYGHSTGLVFTGSGQPRISYYEDAGALWHASRDGLAWQHEVIDPAASEQVGPLRLDSADAGSIVYRGDLGGITGVIYASQ